MKHLYMTMMKAGDMLLKQSSCPVNELIVELEDAIEPGLNDRLTDLFHETIAALRSPYEPHACYRLAQKMQGQAWELRPSWKNTLRLPGRSDRDAPLRAQELLDFLDAYKFYERHGRIYNTVDRDTGWVTADLDKPVITPEVS